MIRSKNFHFIKRKVNSETNYKKLKAILIKKFIQHKMKN